MIAPQGVSYVGEGELARICKIAHNVMLGVVIENLIEITLLANKMGVPRHAFLAFMNNGVMGSMFTRYKSPALVNLDWTTTFTPELLRKDLDLGLALGREWDVPMPVTAATREVLQTHFGARHAQVRSGSSISQKDFAALMETMALASGMKLESENKNVPTGSGELIGGGRPRPLGVVGRRRTGPLFRCGRFDVHRHCREFFRWGNVVKAPQIVAAGVPLVPTFATSAGCTPDPNCRNRDAS